MTLDNIEEQLSAMKPGLTQEKIDELLEKFAYDPESIQYSDELKSLMEGTENENTKKALHDLKSFLSYLNNFIIDKNEGGQTLREIASELKDDGMDEVTRRKMILKEATLSLKEGKSKPFPKDNLEGEVGTIKPLSEKGPKKEVSLFLDDDDPKLVTKAFNEKKFLTASQFDLDDIEESVLSKKFLEGPKVITPNVVVQPSPGDITPTVDDPQPQVTPSNRPEVVTNPANNPSSPRSEAFVPPSRPNSPSQATSSGSSNTSENLINSLPSGNTFKNPRIPNTFQRSSSFPGNNFKSAKSTPRAKSPENFQDPNAARRNNRGRTQGNKSFNEEINRYKDALSGISDTPSSTAPSNQETQPNRDIASAEQAPGQDKEFEGQETSKKKKSAGAGSRKAGAPSKKKTDDSEDDLITDAKGNKGYRGADGKFVPAFVYKFVLPHLIVDVFGVEEVVKKYKLYGKRFHTLEITDEETFILHTYDFQSTSVPYTSELDDPEYNKVRQEILEQVQLTIAQSRSSKVLNKILEKTDHREERIVKTEVEQIRLSEKMIPFEDVEERFAQN